MNFPIKYVMIVLAFILALLIIIVLMFGFEDAMRMLGLDRVKFIMNIFTYQN